MKYIIPILMIAFLLVMPMVMAKSIQPVDKLDWSAKKLSIKNDGVYDGNDLIKEKSKAEIWIDRKVENTYHVDSLVANDTLVDLYLFYDIQPDTISYRSHNGKYQEVYSYNDWTWKDNCIAEICNGGWAILEVSLEYGTGSNTFTDAITGATWQDDGINVTLVEDTDYTLSTNQFTIINNNVAWNQIRTQYNFLNDTVERNAVNSMINQFGTYPALIGLVGTIIFLGLVIVILVVSFVSNRKQKV